MAGKPRSQRTSASGRHDYEQDENARFWQSRWQAEQAALPPSKQAEEAAHIRHMLAVSPSAALRAYAAARGIVVDGGDDGIRN